jgi:hypothetical protein
MREFEVCGQRAGARRKMVSFQEFIFAFPVAFAVRVPLI